MKGLIPGRIVYFVFDEAGADEVNRRRTTGASIAERLSGISALVGDSWPRGAQAHIGNPVSFGDICPAMVVRVHGAGQDGVGDSVNLKVILDGTDVYWARDVRFAADKRVGSWHWMKQRPVATM